MEHPHEPDPGGPDLGGPDVGPGDGPELELPEPSIEPDVPGGPVLDPVGPDPLDPIDRDDDHPSSPGDPPVGGQPARPDPAAPEPAPVQPPSQVGGVRGPGIDDVDPAGPAPRDDRSVELPDAERPGFAEDDLADELADGLVTDAPAIGDTAPTPDAGDEVRLELDLDPDEGDDLAGLDGTDGYDPDQARDDDLLLPVDDPLGVPVEAFDPVPDNGWLTPTLLASTVGTAAATAMVRRANGAHLTSRSAVASMEQQGVDARVEHGSMAALSDWLASPADTVRVAVHTAGGEPTVCTVVAVDPGSSTALLEEPGPMGMRFDVHLDEFERSWADTAYEVLVAEQGERSVRTLPVTLGEHSLLSPGG